MASVPDAADDPNMRHLFDGDPTFNVYNKDVINMSVGAPGPDLLKHCKEMMSRSTRHRLEEEEKEGEYYLFQYGATAGLWECREELAKFLSRRYGDPVQREQLVSTCGASHGLQMILNTVVSPNGVIFVDQVTYMIALDAFKQFPLMRVATVPMKDDVVDLDALEGMVVDENNGDCLLNEQKIFWAMYYTVPTYHNPTGMTLSADDSIRLVDIARKYQFVVVCDDVYNLLHYGDGHPPHRLFYYDDPKDSNYRGGNVISNGSFSKILSPGIRFGWIESGAGVIKIMKSSGILCSGGAVNHYVSGLIASLIRENIEDEYLDRLVETYKERLEVLCETLNRYLPGCCSFRRPGGGYFVWIRLPSGLDATEFIEWCQKEYKVSAIPGARFSNTGDAKNYLRLSIAFHAKETLRAAAKIIGEALLFYIRNYAPTVRNESGLSRVAA